MQKNIFHLLHVNRESKTNHGASKASRHQQVAKDSFQGFSGTLITIAPHDWGIFIPPTIKNPGHGIKR